MSNWSEVPLGPPDAIFKVSAGYQADTDPRKVNLGVGAYRTDEAKPYYFPVVRKAEEMILADKTANKEYLPIDGLPKFKELAGKFLFGEDHPVIVEKRVCTVQSLSGTGGLRLGGEFIRKFAPGRKLYLPNPTWGNHNAIFGELGLELCKYRWYKAETCALDFDGLKEDILSAPEGSVFLFHTCAHNPTGVDPTHEQWDEIADLCIQKKIIPFFDTAYQGFASGDLANDAYSVRMFARKGIELLASQSFAKNMGLYGERIGAINIVCKDSEEVPRVLSQVKIIVRTMYSNPPMHGAKIVATILGDKELFDEWVAELKEVVARILRMRQGLYDALLANGCPGKWEHIIKQIGMFTFTGLDPDQSDRMLNVHHIYMLRTGRISVAGLTSGSLKYVADCIKEVVEWKMNGKPYACLLGNRGIEIIVTLRLRFGKGCDFVCRPLHRLRGRKIHRSCFILDHVVIEELDQDHPELGHILEEGIELSLHLGSQFFQMVFLALRFVEKEYRQIGL